MEFLDSSLSNIQCSNIEDTSQLGGLRAQPEKNLLNMDLPHIAFSQHFLKEIKKLLQDVLL